MGFKMDFAGFDELQDDLNKLATQELTSIENESLKAGAEIVQKRQIENWNRSVQKDESDHQHIKDYVNIGRSYEAEEGRKMSVGPKMDLRWRAKFVEYGTSYQAPQAPIDKSLSQSESQVYRAMFNVMERRIAL